MVIKNVIRSRVLIGSLYEITPITDTIQKWNRILFRTFMKGLGNYKKIGGVVKNTVDFWTSRYLSIDHILIGLLTQLHIKSGCGNLSQ